jgi:hypothetical protein
MDGSDSCILSFDKACDGLLSARFILADKKISELLQIIAGSKRLYALIEGCTKDFDFFREFRHARKFYEGKGTIELPEGRKKQIAFMFSLLYSFDTKKIDIKEFIHTFYTSHNDNDEFSLFCLALITGFRKNVGAEFVHEEEETVKEDYKKAVVSSTASRESGAKTQPQVISYGKQLSGFRLDDDLTEPDDVKDRYRDVSPENSGGFVDPHALEPPDRLNGLQIDSLLTVAREIIGVVARDASIVTLEREEIMIVCEGFVKAVEYGDINAVKIMYIALKNTIRCSGISRPLQMQSDDLERLIREYGVL